MPLPPPAVTASLDRGKQARQGSQSEAKRTARPISTRLFFMAVTVGPRLILAIDRGVTLDAARVSPEVPPQLYLISASRRGILNPSVPSGVDTAESMVSATGFVDMLTTEHSLCDSMTRDASRSENRLA